MNYSELSNYDVMYVRDYAKRMNDLTFTDYYYRLMLIARSVFKWNNLPNGIDERWIERYLFLDGACMFFQDDDLGFMVAKVSSAGNLNAYDEPVTIRPIATNYTGRDYTTNEDAFIIRNNDLMIPTRPTVELYAMRLADISRTIDVNVHAQKTPTLILCTDKQKMTLKNVYKQWSGNEPVIFGDKQLDIEGVKVLKTDAPVVFPQLQIQKHAYWNECMTFLGIDNANMDKRERLVDDEVNANNEQIEISCQTMLKARERACEQINKAFGLNISVEKRTTEFLEDFLNQDDKPDGEVNGNDK